MRRTRDYDLIRMTAPGASPDGDPAIRSSDAFIEQQLDLRLTQVATQFDADALSFTGGLLTGVDDLVRLSVEPMAGASTARRRLVFLLTTPGGYLAPVQRIVTTIRRYYDHVDFVIPNQAFSAGTVLAMSGDRIFMDYFAHLGPIDPQVETRSGTMVPASGTSSSGRGYSQKRARRT